MSLLSSTSKLKQDITILEVRREQELLALKEQFRVACQSLKPVNLLKSTVKEVTESPEIMKGVGNAALGVASGYLVKSLLFGTAQNPILKLAGVAAQAVITGLVAKNSDSIKNGSKKLLKFLLKKKHKSHSNNDEPNTTVV